MAPAIGSEFVPRKYQEEIFNRARDGNVIAALDTGSGKTFISTLLIKWVASQENTAGKAIVFIVPKVTLVEQQGDFFAKHTPLRVSKLHGARNIGLTERATWKKEWESHDIFVMTAQIFLDVLTHSHWSIEKVSLLILDECHHTQKNHPYNGIMREYWQTTTHLRPKVFGMTASPIWNPRDAQGSLAILERNLNATVIGVRDHADELSKHSPKPKEMIKEYPPPPQAYDYPSPTLLDALGILDLPPEADFPWSKVRMRYAVALNSLGPYCAELYLYGYLRHRITQMKIQTKRPDIMLDEYSMDADYNQETTISPEVLEADEILSYYIPFFEQEEDPTRLPISVPLHWCSPKLLVLVDVLAALPVPFQGIVFVEQRQVAACLARVLPHMAALKDRVKCAQLVGHGSIGNAGGGGTDQSGMGLTVQRNVVQMFRDGELNLLIATSVAEEGLDFPECDIVIRFDPLQHMVGYLQSRGRARNKTSTYIVMVQANTEQLSRYRALMESEPELRRAYQTREDAEAEEIEEDDDDPDDLKERERYVVESTGAILTYDSSISLLAYLCSLIPRDSFTSVHLPKYTGEFTSTIQLPSTIPLPPSKLVYTGPIKRSKKEAKRAAAFLAVKHLHALKVFDDHLLPVSSTRGRGTEDADGRPLGDIRGIKSIMDVNVRDPWTDRGNLWVHVVDMDGKRLAGIVTGTMLPPVAVVCNGRVVRTHTANPVRFDAVDERQQRAILHDYMKLAVWFCNTGRPITLPLTLFLVPLTRHRQPDFDEMIRLVTCPLGSYDWAGVGPSDYGRLILGNGNEWGRTIRLMGIRHDLSPLSATIPGSKESAFRTYEDYYRDKWTRLDKREPHIPTDCPLIEVERLEKQHIGQYAMPVQRQPESEVPLATVQERALVPQGCCRIIALSAEIHAAFGVLPQLARRITDVFRARQARFELGLPPITDNLLTEAFTLPNAVAKFSNQRFETVGDSVLKLAVTVHIFNKYPHRHEGQLSNMRIHSIANKTLLARAKEVGLEGFLTSEIQSVFAWRYTSSENSPLDSERPPSRYATRQYPRRSLQDCMEATLGAAFVTGGISMALRAGDRLGLAFGGSLPWSLRYGRHPEPSPRAPLFDRLEESLGYTFHRGELLLEALTHPSFSTSSNPSYQRLEFLGDALIDLVVVKYLYDKFPTATSGQLSWARSRAICSPALAAIAVQRLGIHRIILINSAELSTAIVKYLPLLQSVSPSDIVRKGWKLDPPKAISDVFESLVGAVLVDSAWNYEKAEAVVEEVMWDVLEVLSPDLPQDPVSELLVWSAKAGCQRIAFLKSKSTDNLKTNDSVSVRVHDTLVAGPITGSSMLVSKGLAAERAHHILNDITSNHSLQRLCNCPGAKHLLAPKIPLPQTNATPEVPDLSELEEAPPDDGTEDGFALLAQMTLLALEGPAVLDTAGLELADKDQDNSYAGEAAVENEEREVAMLLTEV